jgi:hypothetical protein
MPVYGEMPTYVTEDFKQERRRNLSVKVNFNLFYSCIFPYVCMIKCFYFFLSSVSSFSSQYPLLKPSRSCILSTNFFHFPRVSFNAITKKVIFFRTYLIQLAFQRRILFMCPLLSYTFKNFFSYFLWPFYLLHSPLAQHFEVSKYLGPYFLLVSRSLNHIKNAPYITPNQFLPEFNI